MYIVGQQTHTLSLVPELFPLYTHVRIYIVDSTSCKIHTNLFIIEFIEGNQPEHHLEAVLLVDSETSNATARQTTNSITGEWERGLHIIT